MWTDIRQPVDGVGLKGFVVKADDEIAATAVAESQRSPDDFRHTGRVVGIDPAPHLDARALGQPCDKLLNEPGRNSSGHLTRALLSSMIARKPARAIRHVQAMHGPRT
jgi:hypothetical protein